MTRQTVQTKLEKALAWFFIALISGLRPLLGPSNVCTFTIGCTPYAIDQLKTQPLWPALKNISYRFYLCSPFSRLFK
jgi:putative component of membrane protein insertase Oxa1/YidC/SpoIIIJ protein YidD